MEFKKAIESLMKDEVAPPSNWIEVKLRKKKGRSYERNPLQDIPEESLDDEDRKSSL